MQEMGCYHPFISISGKECRHIVFKSIRIMNFKTSNTKLL